MRTRYATFMSSPVVLLSLAAYNTVQTRQTASPTTLMVLLTLLLSVLLSMTGYSTDPQR